MHHSDVVIASYGETSHPSIWKHPVSLSSFPIQFHPSFSDCCCAARSSELPTSDGRPGQLPEIPPTPAWLSYCFCLPLPLFHTFLILVLFPSVIVMRARLHRFN
ncbi:hypothetical protein LY78DRAFT_123163 [Colletotrichum sublineola]|nr:hypothetical protein LY78DRAFT_123163 [Colletotrichum sublineola]